MANAIMSGLCTTRPHPLHYFDCRPTSACERCLCVCPDARFIRETFQSIRACIGGAAHHRHPLPGLHVFRPRCTTARVGRGLRSGMEHLRGEHWVEIRRPALRRSGRGWGHRCCLVTWGGFGANTRKRSWRWTAWWESVREGNHHDGKVRLLGYITCPSDYISPTRLTGIFRDCDGAGKAS